MSALAPARGIENWSPRSIDQEASERAETGSK
jgi:hypothetical protein